MLSLTLFLLLFPLSTTVLAGNLIDGSRFVNQVKISEDLGEILPEFPAERGIFIQFTKMKIEISDFGSNLPNKLPCWDYLLIEEFPSMDSYYICGDKSSSIMYIHVKPQNLVSQVKYQLSKFNPLFFNATKLSLKFWSDESNPSYFAFWYFSDVCTLQNQASCFTQECPNYCPRSDPSGGYCWNPNNSYRGIDVNGSACMTYQFDLNAPDPTPQPTLAPTTRPPTKSPTTGQPTSQSPTIANITIVLNSPTASTSGNAVSSLTSDDIWGIIVGSVLAIGVASVWIFIYIRKRRKRAQYHKKSFENDVEVEDFQGSEDLSIENRVASPSVSVIKVSPSLYGVNHINPNEMKEKIKIHKKKYRESIPPPPPPLPAVGEAEAGEAGEVEEIHALEVGEVAELPPSI